MLRAVITSQGLDLEFEPITIWHRNLALRFTPRAAKGL
jgi:hypothetical protein